MNPAAFFDPFTIPGMITFHLTLAQQWAKQLQDACGQVGPGLRKLLRRAEQQGQSYDMARGWGLRWGGAEWMVAVEIFRFFLEFLGLGFPRMG